MGFSSERATMALILNEGKVEESVAWLFEGGEEADNHKGQNLDGGSEGDLEKAAETLRAQRHDPPVTPKPEATGDPPNINNGRPSVAVTQNLLRAQSKSNSSSTIQTRKEEKDFNYTKTAVGVPACLEAGSKMCHCKKDSTKTGVPPPPPKAETRYVAVGSEPKTLQPGSLREPVIVMQRPQSINSKQVLASISSSPGAAAGWYPNNVEVMKSNGLLSNIITARSLSPNNLSANQLYHHHHHQAQLVSSSSPVVPPGAIQGNDSWSRMSTSPNLSAASSLGLFSWLGSNNLAGSSSSVDWSSGGSMNQLDYTNIDWSLDRSSPLSTNSSGLWQGLAFMNNPTPMYDSSTPGMGVKPTMSTALPNGNMISNALLQDGGMASAEASAASSREWTSPFEGKDLFSLPRQFVSSPSQ
ncbi:hypothetical protein CK203_055307 [Vitis vinifera]|uniref:UBA domain-containing protein n=1 Tax=Vitis vinifera TaxID=29760 RepID=A0A438GV08_VITVI|nr:hypothetical protein CK203_055307 [Vitis vinifera]